VTVHVSGDAVDVRLRGVADVRLRGVTDVGPRGVVDVGLRGVAKASRAGEWAPGPAKPPIGPRSDRVFPA
jgi:hypothetical protein